MMDLKARMDRELEERFLRYTRMRQSTVVKDETATNKPQLKMKWVIVTENGKRQLRMQWSVRANSNAARQALQTSSGNRVAKRQDASREFEAFGRRVHELSNASSE